jgi:hypothetical protein
LKTCIDYLLDIYDTKIMKMDKFYWILKWIKYKPLNTFLIYMCIVQI